MPRDIELHSEPVQEIMGQIPRWIIRWGITLILVVLLIVFTGSWIFKYPEIITSKITITSENPPTDIIARANGKITHLHVADSQKVYTGEILSIIENSADYKDVLYIDSLLHIEFSQFNSKIQLINGIRYNLGEIQTVFSSYMNLLSDYNNFIEMDYYQVKVDAMKEEIKGHYYYKKQMQDQVDYFKKELLLAKRQLERDSILYKNGIIAPADYDNSTRNYYKVASSYSQVKANLASSDITISSIKQKIIDLLLEKDAKQREFISNLKEVFDNLTASTEQWKKQYLLISPVDGIVTFNKYWSENQNINTGDVVFTVIPEEQGKIIGITELPVNRSGKVKRGQRINIKIDNYPYIEYGMLNGVVESKSLVPNNDIYSVRVKIDQGLVTWRNISLDFNQEMQGMAEIITEDLRLIERIINPIRIIFEKNR